MCGNPEWINGLSYPISDSYHPNATGHASGHTPTVSPVLVDATVAVTAQLVADAEATGADQAQLQSKDVEADRSIEPKEFFAPDLTTPHARRIARKAGVDLRRYGVR